MFTSFKGEDKPIPFWPTKQKAPEVTKDNVKKYVSLCFLGGIPLVINLYDFILIELNNVVKGLMEKFRISIN